TRADGEHSDIFGVLVCLRPGDQHCDAGGGAVCAWTGHGWGVEYRGDAGGRELAYRVASQGDFDCAEFLGAGICGGRARGRPGIALLRLAGGVLRWDSAGLPYAVDPAPRPGVRDVAGTELVCRRNAPSGRRKRPTSPKIREKWGTRVGYHLPAAVRAAHLCAAAVQLFRDVCLVGIVYLASALSIAPCRAGRAGSGRDGNDHADDRTEPVRDVSRLCQLWLGSGSAGSAE